MLQPDVLQLETAGSAIRESPDSSGEVFFPPSAVLEAGPPMLSIPTCAIWPKGSTHDGEKIRFSHEHGVL